MEFWREFVQSISQPPGSFVYHTVTLFALQVTLGLAWWQMRQRPGEPFVRRATLAAGGILLARLFVFLVVLLVSEAALTTVLPPIESAVAAVTAVLLVWALTPRLAAFPRLDTVVLVLLLAVIGLMYTFFAGQWPALMDAGTPPAAYESTSAARVWLAFQSVLLLVGAGLILYKRQSYWFSRLLILLVMLAPPLIELTANTVQANGPNTEWQRLGYLFALPLLAILVYRYNLSWLHGESGNATSNATPYLTLLQQVRELIRKDGLEARLTEAFAFLERLVAPAYAALILPLPEEPEQLQVFSRRPEERPGEGAETSQLRRWVLQKRSWPALNSAFSRAETVVLLPDGVGARQLHALYQELSVDGAGALRVAPLTVSGETIGLLLLSLSPRSGWDEGQSQLVDAAAHLLAELLQESRLRDDESEFSRLRAAEIAAAQAQAEAKQLSERLKELGRTAEGPPNSTLSARLEQAQTHIRQLEAQLQRSKGEDGQAILARARELRAPVSALRSYAHLLQSNTTGELNRKQLSLVGRIEANVRQLNAMLDDLISLAQRTRRASPLLAGVDVRQAIEEAVEQSKGVLEEKELDVVVELDGDLPTIPGPRVTFVRLVAHALQHACQVSDQRSQVRIRAHMDRLSQLQVNEASGGSAFLQLDVVDSGGDQSQEIHAMIRRARKHAKDASLQAELTQNGRHLVMAEELVKKRGGRIWVHGEPGAGSAFSALIPVIHNGHSPDS
ncbi:MAG: HAMP domain-containing sensor histidine kinase [Candidatus Promineifilaceae bacterium]|nr:HAMP domain-containing sensor histidine kinase [Candidatus Promineifilaceae bacterium]